MTINSPDVIADPVFPKMLAQSAAAPWHQSQLGFLATHRSVEWFSCTFFSLCISFPSLQSWCPNSHSHWDCSGSAEQNPLCFPSLSRSAVFDSLSFRLGLGDSFTSFYFTFISVCEKSGEQTGARVLQRFVKTRHSLHLICRMQPRTDNPGAWYDPGKTCIDTITT